jgi:hypothetical protein
MAAAPPAFVSAHYDFGTVLKSGFANDLYKVLIGMWQMKDCTGNNWRSRCSYFVRLWKPGVFTFRKQHLTFKIQASLKNLARQFKCQFEGREGILPFHILGLYLMCSSPNLIKSMRSAAILLNYQFLHLYLLDAQLINELNLTAQYVIG